MPDAVLGTNDTKRSKMHCDFSLKEAQFKGGDRKVIRQSQLNVINAVGGRTGQRGSTW